MKAAKTLRFIKAFGIAAYHRSKYTAAIVATIFIGILIYYALLPGSWFLKSTDVVVNSAQAGQEVPFQWCRQPRSGAIQASAVRTFYRRDPGSGRFVTAGEYHFEMTVEPVPTGCAALTLKPSRQPQLEGVYYFVTDLSWKENGWEKQARFTSNQYSLIATPDSLRQRISQLEDEVQQLRDRLAAADQAVAPLTVPNTVQSPIQAITKLTPTPTEPGTATTDQPSTSGGAGDPPASPPAPRPSVLRGLLNVVDDQLPVLEGIL